MNEFSAQIFDQLDGYTPEPDGWPDWRDVVVRARKQRTHRLLVALAAAVIVLGSATAVTAALGGFDSWLVGEPGFISEGHEAARTGTSQRRRPAVRALRFPQRKLAVSASEGRLARPQHRADMRSPLESRECHRAGRSGRRKRRVPGSIQPSERSGFLRHRSRRRLAGRGPSGRRCASGGYWRECISLGRRQSEHRPACFERHRNPCGGIPHHGSAVEVVGVLDGRCRAGAPAARTSPRPSQDSAPNGRVVPSQRAARRFPGRGEETASYEHAALHQRSRVHATREARSSQQRTRRADGQVVPHRLPAWPDGLLFAGARVLVARPTQRRTHVGRGRIRSYQRRGCGWCRARHRLPFQRRATARRP